MIRAEVSPRSRRPVAMATTVILAVTLLGSTTLLIRDTLLRPTSITAYFTKAIGIYPGDTVQVAGVTVGHIDRIQPEGTKTRLTLSVDRGVPIPAQAKAVIVAQNLVAARYVELTPAYDTGNGPTMNTGAVIPLERTAVPVEWDQVKDQLMRLTTDLGPRSPTSTTSVSRFINTTADAMAGNGDKLRHTLTELSKAARILSAGGGDITAIITDLDSVVTALRDSNTQIVQFQNRFATLTTVLDESRSDLDAALTTLSSTIVDVQRFIANTRDHTAEQIQHLANITQNLVDHRLDLENVLHVAPNSIANGYNIYNPDTGSVWGTFVMTPFSNPEQLICGAIGAVENVTSTETGKLCAQYLGPTLRSLSLNEMPVPINPYLSPSAKPENIVYADPALAPGGPGPAPTPPEQPPAISAYELPGAIPPKSLPQLLLPPATADTAGPSSDSAPPATPPPPMNPQPPSPTAPGAR